MSCLLWVVLLLYHQNMRYYLLLWLQDRPLLVTHLLSPVEERGSWRLAKGRVDVVWQLVGGTGVEWVEEGGVSIVELMKVRGAHLLLHTLLTCLILYVCTLLHAHSLTHTCTHAHMHTCTHACMHTHMYIHAHMHTHTHTTPVRQQWSEA